MIEDEIMEARAMKGSECCNYLYIGFVRWRPFARMIIS